MASSESGGLSYRDAGVDREAAGRAKDRIIELVRGTLGPEVLSRPGSFGGIYRVPTDLATPALVASADGVGTKLKVAIMAGKHDTVGRDLVNHCVDDILVEGARPLFFLDYIGMGRLAQGTVEALVSGMAAACRENGAALLGGETAEMPDFYAEGDYDLAGFIVGAVEAENRPGAHRVQAGDVLVGLASDGFHTNGYSLLRRLLFDKLRLGLDDELPGVGLPVGEVLLAVHRSYLRPVMPLLQAGRVKALAHITGGGIPENLARVLPEGVEAHVQRSTWEMPLEFEAVQELGGISDEEMYRTFNMGVGMILVVAAEDEVDVSAQLRAAGEDAWGLGVLEPGDGGVLLI
ncbi:MAG TPA: phosphoribosylformylglycinamidine cyclo-ligase [Longimicrobiales bacterium]|nr:phosphoribosylformylglycinamidine cyclo-ligase [Longimicrobiales bacterium]